MSCLRMRMMRTMRRLKTRRRRWMASRERWWQAYHRRTMEVHLNSCASEVIKAMMAWCRRIVCQMSTDSLLKLIQTMILTRPHSNAPLKKMHIRWALISRAWTPTSTRSRFITRWTSKSSTFQLSDWTTMVESDPKAPRSAHQLKRDHLGKEIICETNRKCYSTWRIIKAKHLVNGTRARVRRSSSACLLQATVSRLLATLSIHRMLAWWWAIARALKVREEEDPVQLGAKQG